MISPKSIRSWMRKNVSDYVDECGEVNCTRMVEDWDSECASGEDTLDPNHIVWVIAVEVATEYEQEMR